MPATLDPYYWPLDAGTQPLEPPPAGHRVIGHDGTAYFVEVADGTISSVNPASPLDTCFVNTSEHHFLASLGAFADRRAAMESTDGEVALDAVQSLRHELNRLDIACLGDRDHWWAVILDRYEDGLP